MLGSPWPPACLSCSWRLSQPGWSFKIAGLDKRSPSPRIFPSSSNRACPLISSWFFSPPCFCLLWYFAPAGERRQFSKLPRPPKPDHPSLPAWQTRWGQLFLPGSIFLAAASYLLSLYTGQILGAGFLLALSFYILAWLLRKSRLRGRSLVSGGGGGPLRYLFFQFSLIFLLRCLAFPSTWRSGLRPCSSSPPACSCCRPAAHTALDLAVSLALVLLSFQINHWVSSIVYDEISRF